MLKLNNRRKVSISNVCRTCLTERRHLRDIFSARIPKMLETITSVQVSEKDGLPPNICVTCFHLITKFYNYKKKVEKNDKYLQNHRKKIIEKDILDVAINDAKINPEVEFDNVNMKLDSHAKVSQIQGYPSEENIPSSEQVLEKGRKAQSLQSITSGENYFIRKESDLQEVLMEDTKEELLGNVQTDDTCSGPTADRAIDIVQNDSVNLMGTPVFPEGPPPLIPLEPQADKPSIAQINERILSIETPPLVPIKPIVNAESILTIIKSPEDIKLKCTSCSIDFSTIEALKQHKLNNCQTTNLQCSICKKEFRERKKLIGHLKGHMVVKGYGCKICDKRYPNPSTFTVHMRTHTGERPFKCEVCGKGFVRWAGLVGHFKTHQPHRPYKCPTCGKSFKIASNLERHKVLHSESLPFCCNYCGKTFSQSDNLQLHIRTYHTYERPYLCNECGKGFVNSTRLNRHMWSHSGYKPYQCQLCSKAYSNSNDLKIHERTHTGNIDDNDKPYACKICEMRFYHPCRLNKHMKTHNRSHSCPSCHKTFSSAGLLLKHVKGKHKTALPEDPQDPLAFVQEVIIDSRVFADCE